MVRPPETMPPTWRDSSMRTTLAPERAAATAAATPPGVAPTITTSVCSAARTDVRLRRRVKRVFMEVGRRGKVVCSASL
jgi:hypothetical protein